MLRLSPKELAGTGRTSRLGASPGFQFLGLVALILAGTLIGCSGGGGERGDRVVSVTELPTDPEAALETLDAQIAASPKDHRPRIARAELLETLERYEEAAEEWRAILARNPTSKLRDRAWRGRAHTLDAACGPLRIIGENEPKALEHARLTLEAWGHAFKHDKHRATLGQVRALYRLGRFKEGLEKLVKFEADSAPDSEERCLALLFEEQREAAPLAVVRGLDTFARSSQKAVRELAVEQLIRFAGNAAQPEISHTAEGLLVRLSREQPSSSDTLVEWQMTRTQGSTGRLAIAHRQRAMDETSDALDRGRPLQAWRTLEPLLRGEDEGSPELVAMVNQCCSLLCELCREKLELGDVSSAGEAVSVIRALPKSWFGVAERECADEMLHAHQVAAIRSQAEGTLVEAKKAVDEHRPEAALTALDPLLDQFPAELVPEVQMIRARALAQRGAPADALALLERYGPFSDPQVQRLHGSLLASVGRGEEAEAILESLPLKFFNVEAFDALLAALEQQSKWEKLIARLNTLGGELPTRYRPIRRRAVVGAANRMIENLDPQGAIDLLQATLDDKELLSTDSGPILVRAMLETGQTDEALKILTDETGGLESVPANLVKMVADRASKRLEPEQRFQLLRRLPEWERDTSTSEFLASNWPRYGEYLPRPGRYEATYQVRTYGEEGEVLTDKVERALIEWKGSYFVVDGIGENKETWRSDGDLWIRTTFENEWWVSIRADENPPLPEIVSPDGVKAQLVEAGHTVSTKLQAYSGCLGIDVFLPNLGPDEKIRIEIAPEIGEVSWKRYIGRLAVETRELIDWSVLGEDD